jgi:hypothetical protein
MVVSGGGFEIVTTSATGDTPVSALSVDNHSSFTVLLTLRVTALYRDVRLVVWMIWVSFVVFQGFRLGILSFGTIAIFGELSFNERYQQTDFAFAESIIYSPISRVCIAGSMSYRPTGLIGVPVIFDLLLLVLTARKAIRSPASLRSSSIVCVKFWLSPCRILRCNSSALHFGPG